MQIVIVVVLYKRSPAQSRTMNSLAAAFEQNPELLHSFRVFIWDNSPNALVDAAVPFPYDYGHNGRNLGTSGAYNHAMEFAEAQGSPWIRIRAYPRTSCRACSSMASVSRMNRR
jgi:GT2 family glycosyltransferase